jgi:hypothetical protein
MKFLKTSSPFGFLALALAAAMFSYVPVAHWPFSWASTFFHEISHGMAAVATGGSAESIRLHWFGSGLCTTVGGWRFPVLWFGYGGAVLWGAAIYRMADGLKEGEIRLLLFLLLGLIGGSAALLARDAVTIFILCAIGGALFFGARARGDGAVKLLLKFAGLYVLLDAVKAPLRLIDGRHIGDGAKLADMTLVPEMGWALTWHAFGLFVLYYLYKAHK